MAGINHLRQVKEKKGDNFLNGLLNNYVIINKKTDGTFFGVRKDRETDTFKYYKKAGQITYVDRMLMKYYNPAISHFEKLSKEKKQRIPSNFYFGFEYLTKKDSSSNNKIVLSYIHRLDDDNKPIETFQSKQDLEKWAYYLEVDNPPILFEGMLDDDQKTKILEFVYSPYEELLEKFKTTSFSKYIINMLSDDDDENSEDLDISSIIFRFYDENDENPKHDAFLAKIVDPLFQESIKSNKSENPKKSSDYIWLIVIDLMNHIEMFSENDLKNMCGENKESYDSKYISLINEIFKDFISVYEYKYDGLVLDIPEYLKREEFDIDYDLISDGEINDLIKGNETYREIYRILLNFFRKVRRKSSAPFFNEDLISQLNIQVGKIKRIVMGDVLYEGLFPSFNEYIGAELNDTVYVGEHENLSNNKNKKVESTKVNVLIGKFQPINMGHIKAAQSMHNKNNYPCVFISVMQKNTGSIFSEKSVNIMLKKVQQEYSDIIKDVKIVKDSSIENILKAMRPEYDPILWASGSSKIKDYALQLEYIKNKDIPLRISNSLKLVELPSYYKSKDVISAIDSLDFNKFKEMVPKSIASEFFNLQREIESNRK